MGVFIPGKLACLTSPGAAMLGAGMLALIILLPAPVEAHFIGRNLEVRQQQLEITQECSLWVPGRSRLRAVDPCKGSMSAKAALPVFFSGKFSAALVAELYCRTGTVDLSQFTHKDTGNIPHPVPQRVIAAQLPDAVEWPRCQFGTGPDRGIVEAFLLVRQPDG